MITLTSPYDSLIMAVRSFQLITSLVVNATTSRVALALPRGGFHWPNQSATHLENRAEEGDRKISPATTSRRVDT